MSESNQKVKAVPPTTNETKEEAPPSPEQRAAKLHQDISEANPGRDVDITVGDHGRDRVHIETRSGNRTGNIIGGVFLGVLGVGAAAALGLLAIKGREQKAAAEANAEAGPIKATGS